MEPLNLFYEEPQKDRWLPLDRYPRQIIRRLVRGKPRPGGHTRVFLNLCAGLKRLNIPYRVNDYKYAQSNKDDVACIIGKPQVLTKINWHNPILFGAAIYSHPTENVDLLDRYPIRRILVPGEWMRRMCEEAWGSLVTAWPVGIDTEYWAPVPSEFKDVDVLLYDKVRWEHERYADELINPIKILLEKKGLTVESLRYGFYKEEDFHHLLKRAKTMIFLCEHETQGIAYQQALSCNVPVLAWDRGGFWQDPYFYPHKVQFAPVSSVPYWDERCGLKFKNIEEFSEQLDQFIRRQVTGEFSPRLYILENLTLERCARQYVEILNEVKASLT